MGVRGQGWGALLGLGAGLGLGVGDGVWGQGWLRDPIKGEGAVGGVSLPLKMAARTRERTKMRPSLPRNLGTTSRLEQRMWGDTAHPNAIPPMGAHSCPHGLTPPPQSPRWGPILTRQPTRQLPFERLRDAHGDDEQLAEP